MTLFANVIGPVAFPFLAPFTMGVTTLGPVTLLVAVLEWRMIRCAGIRNRPFLHTVLANIISTIVGIVLVFLALHLRDMGLLVAISLLSAPISFAVEGAYLNYISRSGLPLRSKPSAKFASPAFQWKWVLAANIFSWVTIFAIMMAGTHFSDRTSFKSKAWLESIQPQIHVANLLICCAILFWVFTSLTFKTPKQNMRLPQQAADSTEDRL